MSFTVKADIKKVFFDRSQVVSWIGKKKAAFLGHAGGYVRRVARNSMKLKGKARKKNTTKRALREAIELPASAPGTPPNVHSENEVTSLRNIQYGLNESREGVLVGPLALNGNRGRVPGLQERGGSQMITEKLVGRKWVPTGRRAARPGQPTRRRAAKYPPRPFMQPALVKSVPKFPSLFFSAGGG